MCSGSNWLPGSLLQVRLVETLGAVTSSSAAWCLSLLGSSGLVSPHQFLAIAGASSLGPSCSLPEALHTLVSGGLKCFSLTKVLGIKIGMSGWTIMACGMQEVGIDELVAPSGHKFKIWKNLWNQYFAKERSSKRLCWCQADWPIGQGWLTFCPSNLPHFKGIRFPSIMHSKKILHVFWAVAWWEWELRSLNYFPMFFRVSLYTYHQHKCVWLVQNKSP